MANWYINPGLGSGTNAGTSWANAFNNSATAWADAITASSAGDDFYVNAASICNNSTAQTLTFKGTAASPNRIFSCSTITNNPPVSADLGAGAAFTTTGASNLQIDGCIYVYGVNFNCGTGAVSAAIKLGAASNVEQRWESCTFSQLAITNTNSMVIGSNTQNSEYFTNCKIVLNGGSSSTVSINAIWFWWKNSGLSAANTWSAAANTVTIFTPIANVTGGIVLDGVDLSNAFSSAVLLGASTTRLQIQLINCRLPSSVTIGRPTNQGNTIDQIISDTGAGTSLIKQQRDSYQGTLTASTTVYNNATDGVTPISWQVITTANAKPQSPFECFQIVQWVAAGTYASSKVFITSATASLKTNDVWVDVDYLGSGYPLAAGATSFGAGSGSTFLPQIPAGTTPGTLAAASPAWGTGGLGNDYQLAIPSFTTSAAGFVRFTVKVGKASLTVNIDDKVVIA